jgi:F0F1-type ATP synthase membrane subunit b/b'
MVLAIVMFQGVVFIALIFILRHFMKGHVSGAVEHLHKLNDELLKQQAELKQKMADSQREYETKLGKLNEEVQQKQKEAKDEAVKTLDDSRQRALQERDKIITEAVQTRDKIRQEIMAEMEQNAVVYSKEIVAEFFGGDLGKMLNETLVNEVIESLREADLQNFQISGDTAEIRTPIKLSEENRKKMVQVLKEKLKKDVKLKEEIDPSLVGGLVLKFGTFVMDGSLVNRMSEAASRLKKEAARKYQGNT